MSEGARLLMTSSKSKGFCLLRCHEVVTIQRAFNELVWLAGMLHVDLIEAALRLENVLGMPLISLACPWKPAEG